jgi:hypothetical protein
MASKSTPKRFYKKSSGSTENSSRYRLCNGVQDQRHCKNFFNKRNERILNNVELIHGEKLPHVDGFPYFICRPCERSGVARISGQGGAQKNQGGHFKQNEN